MPFILVILCTAFLLALNSATAAEQAPVSNLKADEEIVFFPAVAWSSPDGRWHVPIQGCVWEPERRTVALALLKQSLRTGHVEMTPAEEAILAERARLFMVDHERRKRVVVQLGSERFVTGKTGADGWFRAEIMLSAEQVRALTGASGLGAPAPSPAGNVRAIPFHACLPDGDTRVFAGKALLVGQAGLVVVSDIDDTIKLSNVADRSALLRSTFLEPFKPVDAMPGLYRDWAKGADVHFCYVSASPWQLYALLSQFITSEGFPEGTFHLRQLRWKDRSLYNLFQGPDKHKLAVIGALFEKFPHRRFVLVGDSGEQDPEIYGTLARKYPGQIAAIYIREVDGSPDTQRYQAAFRGLPPFLWQSFRDPANLCRTFADVK